MSKRIVKFRVYPVWNMDGELKWLEEMASLGFRLVKVWPAIYFFECAEPESVHFCHGFRKIKSKDRDEYFQLYSDAGWQHVLSILDWHYFRSSTATATDMDIATVTRANANFLKSFALFYLVGIVLILFCIGSLWIIGTYRLLPGVIICMCSWVFGYLLLSYARRRQLANLEKKQINH